LVSIPAAEAVRGKATHGGVCSLEKIPPVTKSAESSVDPETGEVLEKILIELPTDH